MTPTSTTKDAVLARISPIVDNLMQSESLFQKLDKDELLEIFATLLDKVSPEDIMSLDEAELSRRVDGVMTVEATAGILNDLTPEQMEMYDAAVEGR